MTKPPTVLLRSNDYDLLRSLFESRVMTRAHIAALHFGDRYESAKKRLQRLKAAGLVSERPRNVSDPGILYITRKGIEALRDEGHLSSYPPIGMEAMVRRVHVRESTVTHELAVLDAKVAFHRALKRSTHTIDEFLVWPAQFQFQAKPVGFDHPEQTVKPDGYIQIRVKDGKDSSEYCFFLEVDLSTEDHGTLLRKAACYDEYARSGAFALWRGGERHESKKFQFRLLVIVRTEERRNTLAEQLLHHTPPLTKVYIATREEVETSPIDAIWIRPKGYMAAVEGTAFAKPRKTGFGKGRQRARDEFVRKGIKRIRILE